MRNNHYSWSTCLKEEEHSLPLQSFSERIKSASTLTNNTIKVLKDGEVILQTHDMHISEYENFLLKIAYKTRSI